jgi:hypothetical protein
MKRSSLVSVVVAIALAGCGGGGGGGGSSTDASTCAGFFSDSRMCQFECSMVTGTSASTVASTLHLSSLAVGHGCMDDGGGGMECLVSCKDSSGDDSKDRDVTFFFDSGDKLYHVSSTIPLSQCLVDAGCQ